MRLMENGESDQFGSRLHFILNRLKKKKNSINKILVIPIQCPLTHGRQRV